MFIACSEMLNHAGSMTLRGCERRGGWRHAPDSVVANVSESASSAQNMTVTTMAAFLSFEQLAVDVLDQVRDLRKVVTVEYSSL